MSNIYPPNKCFTCKKNNVSAFNGTYCVEHIPKTTRPPKIYRKDGMFIKVLEVKDE